MVKDDRKWFAYARCSTLKQVKELSIEKQVERIRAFGAGNDLSPKNLVMYADEGVSGVVEKPALERMLADMGNVHPVAIVVNDLTRLGRVMHEIIETITKIQGAGVRLIMMNTGVDTSTPEGRMMIHLLATFAEYERDLTVRRLAEGRAYAMEHGTRSGKPMHRPKKELNEIDWAEVRRLRKIGAPWTVIAKAIDVHRQTLMKRIKEDKPEGVE